MIHKGALIVFVATILLLTYYRTIHEEFTVNCSLHKGKLLPIMDPSFNLKEVVKNMLLLEDHLFQKEKQCKDCIAKHFLLIEGLAEELVTLDKGHKYVKYYNLATKIRSIASNFVKKMDPLATAQELRMIRKPLMHQCFYAS